MGFFDIFRKSVKKTKQSLSLELDSFSGKITFDTLEELEEILILADVGVTTAGKICSRLGERIKRRNIDSTELREMENIPDERRAARFVCSICAVFGDDDIVQCEGACEGTIARRLHGQNGFGYDPLFMVGERSFAELDGPAKDAISHRGRALAALYEKLKDRKEGE